MKADGSILAVEREGEWEGWAGGRGVKRLIETNKKEWRLRWRKKRFCVFCLRNKSMRRWKRRYDHQKGHSLQRKHGGKNDDGNNDNGIQHTVTLFNTSGYSEVYQNKVHFFHYFELSWWNSLQELKEFQSKNNTEVNGRKVIFICNRKDSRTVHYRR